MFRCPGYTSVTVSFVQCPFCDHAVEVWSDETEVKCPYCAAKVYNTNTMANCRDWCNQSSRCKVVNG